MDCAGRAARFLIVLGALPLVAAAAADLPLRAARWTVAGQRVQALSAAPVECLVEPRDPALAEAVSIGRVAFRTPLLIGGQAARAGLSCESCHRSGRDNPHFLFTGLSSAPGTADVTSSLMSSHRGDGIFNPKQIPDLAGPAAQLTVVRHGEQQALLRFIQKLIVEEFDGPEPPQAVLAGLVAYVQSLSPAACGEELPRQVTLDDSVGRIVAALRAALIAWRNTDRATARLMMAGARSELELIDERYRRPGLERQRTLLLSFDQELAAIERVIESGTEPAELRITVALANLPELANALRRAQDASYFNVRLLRQRCGDC